jgi:ATP-binding cassette subfamily B protein
VKHLKPLIPFFIKYRYRFLGGILFVLLSNYFRILSPQVSNYIVDAVTAKITNTSLVPTPQQYNFLVNVFINVFNNNYSITQLVIISGFALLTLAVLGGFFMYLMRQTIIVMSRYIEYDQKNEVYKHYQTLDTEFFKTNAVGDLMNRISEDVSRVRMFTGPAIMYMINLAGTIGFSLYFMFLQNATLTLYVIAPLPILAITIYYVNNIINQKSELAQQNLSTLTSITTETYSGIRVIKSFNQQNSMANFFTKAADSYKNNATSLSKVEALYFPSITLLIGLSTLIAIAFGCIMHLQNPQVVTAGTIVAFVIYINMLTFPVSAIGLTASMIQRAAASQKRLNEFLEIKPTIHTKPGEEKLGDIKTIQFINSGLQYPHSTIWGVNNFSLQLKEKDSILILGKTGSGKSSLVQLLLKNYLPSKGKLLINGIDITTINATTLRQQISYVPQDVFLFSDSIENNILFGNEVGSNAAQLAKKAHIHQEIERFENGYNTLIGERGVTLSGGQKQRISIARALAKNASVYIFDDCLSAVDNNTERAIANNLHQFLKDKISIVIAHRIPTSFSFSKIIVVQDGKLVEEGNHQSLLAINGYYAKLYQKQLTEKE